MEQSELIKQLPNIFLCGLSGCGKDTFMNILRDQAPYYLKIRTAETIKRMVTETNDISFDELEVRKRTEPKLRSQHNEFDNMMRQFTGKPDEISSANRYKMITKRETMDFTNPVISGIDEQLMTNPICVFDGRDSLATETFIKAGYIGIFLTRTNNEFRNKHHETETDNINNGTILKLCRLGLARNIIIIDNDDVERTDIEQLVNDWPIKHIKIGRKDTVEYEQFVKTYVGQLLNEFRINIESGTRYRLLNK